MKTVLLLEDDPISLALYQRILAREWRVLVAGTPQEAVELCRDKSIVLFISDNLLRVTLSGLEALHRAHTLRPDLKLMLVSGTPPEGLDEHDFNCFEELVKTGAFDYLEKPFKADQLLHRAAALIAESNDSATVQQRLAEAKEYRRTRQR